MMSQAANCSKCHGSGFIYFYPTGKELCDCMYGGWRKQEIEEAVRNYKSNPEMQKEISKYETTVPNAELLFKVLP